MSHPARIERPSGEPPRFALCVTAIVKNEASYIGEWLAYAVPSRMWWEMGVA